MYLTNDYSQQVLPDQCVRDVARLAEHNRRGRPAPSNRVRWWRRLLARARQRIGTAAQRRTAQRGIAMPQRRVVRRARPGGCRKLLHEMGR
jgi:hypothetical protein